MPYRSVNSRLLSSCSRKCRRAFSITPRGGLFLRQHFLIFFSAPAWASAVLRWWFGVHSRSARAGCAEERSASFAIDAHPSSAHPTRAGTSACASGNTNILEDNLAECRGFVQLFHSVEDLDPGQTPLRVVVRSDTFRQTVVSLNRMYKASTS